MPHLGADAGCADDLVDGVGLLAHGELNRAFEHALQLLLIADWVSHCVHKDLDEWWMG